MAAEVREHEVEFEDVLGSMAEALVETQAVFRVREIDDPPTGYTTGLKPPKEIFYRNSVTFMTVLPPPIMPKRCSCVYLCTGAKATIKCLSCAIYDPRKVGYYCDICFRARHPWYRVPHIYTNIAKDENIEYSLKEQNRMAQAARLDREGEELLEGLVRNNLQKLAVIGDDQELEDKLIKAGRTSMSLEERIKNLQVENQESIKTSVIFQGLPPALTPEDKAATTIERHVRGMLARTAISLLYTERILSVWDPTFGREFYYDKWSGGSSWTPPRFLLKRHLDKLEGAHDAGSEQRKWATKRLKTSYRVVNSSEEAVRILQKFCLCILARKRVLTLARKLFRRILDEESGCYYYVNMKTTESSWNRPSIFLSEEPPLLLMNERDSAEARSARYNREKVDIVTHNVS